MDVSFCAFAQYSLSSFTVWDEPFFQEGVSKGTSTVSVSATPSFSALSRASLQCCPLWYGLNVHSLPSNL